jgi:putative sterol carrier protein
MTTQDEMAQIFSQMAATFDPSKAEGVNATFQFDLSGDNGGQYWVKLTNGAAESGEGLVENANTVVKAEADDFSAVVNGDMNPMQAFMSGKIKIQGDMGLAMKLQSLIS